MFRLLAFDLLPVRSFIGPKRRSMEAEAADNGKKGDAMSSRWTISRLYHRRR